MSLNNPITEPLVPQAIARDAEVAAAIADHEAKTAPHAGHMPLNPKSIEFGHDSVNVIDLHGGNQQVDFDVRLLCSGGTGQTGRGNLSMQAARLDLVGGAVMSLNNGNSLRRMLSANYTINPTNVAAGGVTDISLAFPGVVAGDSVSFTPISNPYNGLWAFNTTAYAVANGVIIFFHNAYAQAIDLPAFTAKVVVLGFD